jgi:sortase A
MNDEEEGMSPTRRKRTLVGVIVATVLAVGVGATAFVVTRDDTAEAKTVAAPTTTTSSSTTTTVKRTTTTLPPLPQPDPSPLDAYADVPIVQIGTMKIPKINLVHPIFEGVWLTVVDHGPGHWPNSAMPGRRGNSVFAGHRVTHSHPFYDMDLLAPGDKVIFEMPYGTFTYSITASKIVEPTALDIVTPTPTPTITLFACHPKHSAAQRIVVTGKLVSSKLKPGVKPTLGSVPTTTVG